MKLSSGRFSSRIVDDDSTDATSKDQIPEGVTVIRNCKNLGTVSISAAAATLGRPEDQTHLRTDEATTLGLDIRFVMTSLAGYKGFIIQQGAVLRHRRPGRNGWSNHSNVRRVGATSMLMLMCAVTRSISHYTI
jgi:hypothetical protein